MTNPKTAQPWEQQPDESAQAFAAFKLYRDAGASRSVDAAYRASKGLQESIKRAPGRWREWSLVFDWAHRASVYDEYLDGIEQAAREKAAGEQAEKLAAERAQLKRTEFSLAQLLIEKAKTMIEFPLVRTVVEEKRDKAGNVISQTIINPAKWSFRDVVRMFEMGSKLARLGLDLKPTAGGGEGVDGDDDDGNVQWSVKLPPDVDEATWLTVYKPKVKIAKQGDSIGEPVNDKVM